MIKFFHMLQVLFLDAAVVSLVRLCKRHYVDFVASISSYQI